MVLGSFFLTPATALRFERHDRKTRQLTREEEMGILWQEKRKFDMREEYYVSLLADVVDVEWYSFANERSSDWHIKI